jgi:hypothetical protein
MTLEWYLLEPHVGTYTHIRSRVWGRTHVLPHGIIIIKNIKTQFISHSHYMQNIAYVVQIRSPFHPEGEPCPKIVT